MTDDAPDPRFDPFRRGLRRLRRAGLYRDPLCADRRGARVRDEQGVRGVDFSSNDYLGLAAHPTCLEAACDATRWGCGATASKVVSGDFPLAQELEATLADWVGLPEALLFPSGYQANVGSLSALALDGTWIFSDARNHASIIDGCRLAGRTVVVYPHRDVEALSRLLAQAPPDAPKIIVTDGLFSMEGTAAPLAALGRLAQRHGALWVVDEAHSIGVLGPQGRGLCAEEGLLPDVLVVTFSKALGSHGAAVLTRPPLGQWLRQRARALIYSTALPPPSVGAALAAVQLARGAEGRRRRGLLADLGRQLRQRLAREGLPVSDNRSPIVGLPFQGERLANRVQARLRDRGLFVWAFRPPTVSAGSSLLRICLSARHGSAHIDRLSDALVDAVSDLRHALPAVPSAGADSPSSMGQGRPAPSPPAAGGPAAGASPAASCGSGASARRRGERHSS